MIFCILTALMWGLWTLCLKQATRYLPPPAVQGLTTVVNLVLIPGYLYLLHLQKAKVDPSNPLFKIGLAWAVVSVFFAATGGIFNLMALRKLDPGLVAMMCAPAPAVTMLVSVLTGQEHFTLNKGLGALLVILGVVVLSL